MSDWGRSDPVWIDRIPDWRWLCKKKGPEQLEKGWLGQKIALLSIAPACGQLL